MNQTQTRNILGTWKSDYGTMTFTGSPERLLGRWDQPSGQGQGYITMGTFNPNTGCVAISYYQPWNNQQGVAGFVLSNDGNRLEGTWCQGNGNGAWTLSRG